MSARTPINAASMDAGPANPPPHLMVRASAGTGKTYNLSNRYLKLLRQGADPQTILATTFTRKAAGEILERVLGRLAEGAADAGGAKKLAADLHDPQLSLADARRMLAAICRSLHHVSISTIDRLFNRIVQSFRHELGVPPQPVLVADSDPLAAQLRARAIDALLVDDPPQVLIDLLRRLHFDQAQRSVMGAIDGIVSGLYEVYRQAPDAALWSVLQSPEEAGPSSGGAAKNVELAAPLAALASEARDARIAKALRAGRELAQQGRWEEFLESGLGKAVAAGLATYYNKPIPDAVLAAYLPLVDLARAQLVGRVARQTRATHDLLSRFDRHYTALRRQHRVMLFSDLAQKLARELPQLGEALLMEVYYRLDARVGHLLLDEFQDTSMEQWQVLRPFAREICAYGDGSRSFFCVGDVKQAIYGWRGGCAELFAQVEHELSLPDDGGARLNRSYRSSPVVLEAVNAVFGGLTANPALAAQVESAERWAGDFQPHTAQYPDRPGYVELVTSPGGAAEEDVSPRGSDGDEEDTGRGDDDAIAAPAKPAPHETYAAEVVRRVYEQASGRSIGVLVGTNRMVAQMIYLLRGLGLPASGEGGNPVTDDPAVQSVLAALTLADHPGDTVAAYHVSNSPLREIVHLHGTSADHTASVALNLRRSLLGEGYARLIAQWARRLAPSCEARQVQRLTQLVELAEVYEAGAPTLRPGEFVEFVRATRVQEPAPALIRVMTVHRAKGLEFDAVVLPQLERLLGRITAQAVYRERESPTAPISAVFRATSQAVRGLSPRLERAYAQEADRRMQDDLSALYVAMTRPRHALYLIAQPLRAKKDGSPGTRGLTNASAAAILRQALRPMDYDEGFDGEEVLYAQGDKDWAGKENLAIGRSGDWAIDHVRPHQEPRSDQLTDQPINRSTDPGAGAGARRSWRLVSPSALESGGRVRVGDLLALEVSGGRQRGSVIHAFLAQVEYLDPMAPGAKAPAPGVAPAPGLAGLPDDAALLAAARSAWRQAAPETRVDDKLLAQWLSEFKAMMARPAVREAMARPPAAALATTELWRERAFAVRRGDALLHGVFDRVTVRRRGGRVVRAELVDFKTDRGAADGGNLAAMVEQYRPQMQAYRAALAIMLGLSPSGITARLVFLDGGIVREV